MKRRRCAHLSLLCVRDETLVRTAFPCFMYKYIASTPFLTSSALSFGTLAHVQVSRSSFFFLLPFFFFYRSEENYTPRWLVLVLELPLSLGWLPRPPTLQLHRRSTSWIQGKTGKRRLLHFPTLDPLCSFFQQQLDSFLFLFRFFFPSSFPGRAGRKKPTSTV